MPDETTEQKLNPLKEGDKVTIQGVVLRAISNGNCVVKFSTGRNHIFRAEEMEKVDEP